MDSVRNLALVYRHNIDTLRYSPLEEISGALGDLGTLLPLMTALARQGSITLSTTLVFTGAFNIITGVCFGVPLPVQPMKAIAASAISTQLSERETVAAGAWVSAIVLVLTATGLLHWLTRHIPVPVVKGIQLGAGLSLVIAAGTNLLRPLEWVQPPFDNRLWALLVFLVLLATQRLPRFPYALVVVTVGVVCSCLIIMLHDHHFYQRPYFAGWRPRAHLPAFLSHEAIGLALAQLPLTTLNSIIASSALATELFPSPATLPVDAPSVTALGLSVAGMNLVGCWFGCMPTCHGAGGLSAQYRFGARSGASIIFLGLLKMALGLAFGESLMGLLDAFPKSILGILVLAAGLELAKVGSSVNGGASDLWEDSAEGRGAMESRRHLSDEEAGERWTVMLITTAGILAFSNDAVGFAAGMLCHCALRFSRIVERRYKTPVGDEEHAPLLR